MTNRRWFLLIVLWLAAAAMTATIVRAAPVNVLIVEPDADNNPGNGLQYAPVNFAGTTPLVQSGITYHALSDPGSSTVSTLSSHAATVRNRVLAADGPNNPVEVIYCLEAGDFLNIYIKTSLPSSMAIRPSLVGNGIKVVNHSWVGGYKDYEGTPGAVFELDAVRRMDYSIRREDLVMVGGAVSPWGGGPTPLTWANWNGIAVRGTQGFNPLHGDGIGKRHADLWGPKTAGGLDEASSYETPGVAGYAAALIDAADAYGWNNGLNGIRHEVVKSVLMTGADKTDFSTNGFTSWTSNGINNLDNVHGAGRADYAASLAVLSGGPQAMSTVSDITVNAPTVTSEMAGWWYEPSLNANGTQALIVNLNALILTDLTATLAWDVTQTETGAWLDTTDDGVIFADLDLELLPVSFSGGTYTLGSALDIPGLVSKSSDDNVEHLYFTGDTLSPGLYAFVISNNSDFAWDYAFSYRMAATVIPEPCTLILLLVGATLACGVRRSRRYRAG